MLCNVIHLNRAESTQTYMKGHKADLYAFILDFLQ